MNLYDSAMDKYSSKALISKLSSLNRIVIDTLSPNRPLYQSVYQILARYQLASEEIFCPVLCLHEFGGVLLATHYLNSDPTRDLVLDRVALRKGVISILQPKQFEIEKHVKCYSSGYILPNSTAHPCLYFSVCCHFGN